MALIFSPSIAGAFLHNAITPVYSSPSITIFAGAQPTPANLIANWDSTYKYQNGLVLATLSGILAITQPTLLVSLTNLSSYTAVGTGTATWAVLWAATGGSTVAGNSNSTPPSTRFIIIPVSDAVGNGVMRLNTVNLVSGSTFSMSECSFTAQVV